jgi:5-methylcytosine-specific restriction endonuclease McrA
MTMRKPKSIRPQGPKRHVRHENRRTGEPAKAARFRILERDRFTCRACGKTLPETELEVDHVVPLHMDGDDSDANKQTLCRTPCHRDKTAQEQSTRFRKRE